MLGAALILGALGDWLLRAIPWGVNFSLWVAALAGAAPDHSISVLIPVRRQFV